MTTSRHGTKSRYQLGCRCNECKKANTIYTQEWRKNNPNAVKQHRQKYNQANREKNRQRSVKYYIDNLEHVRARNAAYSKEWRKENKNHLLEQAKQYNSDAQLVTRKKASNHRQPWSDIEIAIALDRQYSVEHAAFLLERAFHSVKAVRHRYRAISSS